MTMDVSNRKDVFITKSDEGEVPQKKRSFDVAFLMLPDEKLKQKQKVLKYEEPETQSDTDEEIEVDAPKIDFTKKFYTQKQQIFGDPKISSEKSAFTKVSLNKERLSVSPELPYQTSLSPSPPIRNYQSFLSPFRPTYQTENFENPFNLKSHELLHPNFAKLRPVAQYRPELAYNYHFQPQEMLKMAQQHHHHQQQQQQQQQQQHQHQPELAQMNQINQLNQMRNPAAAILSTLLPPSLAALSLPAQNVCAKCNISFRMTSDLVYHMRSHHKNEQTDHTKRKREEKLKCPVCAESFRERHHLTRHMTAHQDKDNDAEETDDKKKSYVYTK